MTYQVLGHSKTILVLLGGWLFLGESISARQAAGMAIAVLGMIAYGIITSQCATLLAQPIVLLVCVFHLECILQSVHTDVPVVTV